MTWTLDDARKAGLAGRPSWTRYPRAMLTVRATAELARLAFPDTVGAARYAVEELEDGLVVVPDVEVTTPAAESMSRRRRRPARRVVDVEADSPIIEPSPRQEVTPVRPPLPGEPLEPAELAISDAERKLLNVVLRAAGISDRTHKTSLRAAIAGRQIASSNDLTMAEAGAVIDAAKAVVDGQAEWAVDEDGAPIGVRFHEEQP